MSFTSSPDICISLKALPEGTTLNQIENLTNQINSIFKSEVITLKCINGVKPTFFYTSNSAKTPFSAQEIINEVSGK